jgi:hypothetical protein
VGEGGGGDNAGGDDSRCCGRNDAGGDASRCSSGDDRGGVITVGDRSRRSESAEDLLPDAVEEARAAA